MKFGSTPKAFLFCFVAVMALSAVAQGPGMKPGRSGVAPKKGDRTELFMMMGLSSPDRKAAEAILSKMSPAERTVFRKRGSICLMDKHKGLKLKTMSDTEKAKHFMSGLSDSEQKTLKGIMSKWKPAEKTIGDKMLLSCCSIGAHRG